MNLTILFVFICIIALIIYEKYVGKQQPRKYTLAFAQKGGGGRGGGPKRGGGARGGAMGGARGGARGGGSGGAKGGGSGPSDSSGGGSGDCGLPVKTVDELSSIFNIIGFKFNGVSNSAPAKKSPPPKLSNKLPKTTGGGAGQPPAPGSNNAKIDAILQQMLK